ncbi:MAG TPA: hypothetical protein PKY82_26315 [Pyrinomonadaceae bacterium]|nr:hypothetical protein [Pyrinomonadaceae bacterium]
MNTNLIEQLKISVKDNPRTTMWRVFDVLYEHYRKTYQNPVEMLERDLQSNFNMWNPTKETCSYCGTNFPDSSDFTPIGYADFRDKKFDSLNCAETWLDEYRKTTKPSPQR